MKPGLYEQLLTLALHDSLAELADPRLCEIAPVDAEDAHTVIAQFLAHILADGLATLRGAEAADRQQRLVERMVATLAEELGEDWTQQLSIATPLRRLLAIHAQVHDSAPDRPDTPLARSALLTGTRLDPSLGSQLRKEIATADRVDRRLAIGPRLSPPALPHPSRRLSAETLWAVRQGLIESGETET